MKKITYLLLGLAGLTFCQFANAAPPAPPPVPDVDVNIKVEVYKAEDEFSFVGGGTVGFCYFDVPAGKLLQIEKVTGSVTGSVPRYVRTVTDGAEHTTWLVPRIWADPNVAASTRVYEAENGGYASDTDTFADDDGTLRDIQVVVNIDASSSYEITCSVHGKLFDAPAP